MSNRWRIINTLFSRNDRQRTATAAPRPSAFCFFQDWTLPSGRVWLPAVFMFFPSLFARQTRIGYRLDRRNPRCSPRRFHRTDPHGKQRKTTAPMKIAGFSVTTAYFPLDVDTLNITGSSSLPMIKPTTSPSGIPQPTCARTGGDDFLDLAPRRPDRLQQSVELDILHNRNLKNIVDDQISRRQDDQQHRSHFQSRISHQSLRYRQGDTPSSHYFQYNPGCPDLREYPAASIISSIFSWMLRGI